MIAIASTAQACSLLVRVQPRASRNAIAGEHDGALKVRLTAPPVEGRANDALCRFLAECLDIPVSAVRIAGGERSRTKRVEIRGVTPQQVQEAVSRQLSAVSKKSPSK